MPSSSIGMPLSAFGGVGLRLKVKNTFIEWPEEEEEGWESDMDFKRQASLPAGFRFGPDAHFLGLTSCESVPKQIKCAEYEDHHQSLDHSPHDVEEPEIEIEPEHIEPSKDSIYQRFGFLSPSRSSETPASDWVTACSRPSIEEDCKGVQTVRLQQHISEKDEANYHPFPTSRVHRAELAAGPLFFRALDTALCDGSDKSGAPFEQRNRECGGAMSGVDVERPPKVSEVENRTSQDFAPTGTARECSEPTGMIFCPLCGAKVATHQCFVQHVVRFHLHDPPVQDAQVAEKSLKSVGHRQQGHNQPLSNGRNRQPINPSKHKK
mmetsp:Transcript_1890/g.3616  ORF Transcript_1890/g.3616 Transcript_1890/m.3616 type:complete len:322 (-) Transcript_1890:527-1492(-)